MSKNFWLAVSLCVSSIQADTLEVGRLLETMSLQDQFGKPQRIESSRCSMLLVTADRSASTRVKDFLQKRKGDFLQAHNACFLVDIHAIPDFIKEWVVLPKMRKADYRIFLVTQPDVFPSKEDAITVLELGEKNRIRSVRYLEDPKELFR